MHDLVIVGAGPAGTAAALSARATQPDASVLLIDRAAFPRDKACGDAIGPQAVATLAHLGVFAVLNGYPALSWFELSAGDRHSVRRPLTGPTYTVPRRVLDDRLVRSAVRSGAQLRRQQVRTVVQHADRVVIDGDIDARVVVAADGANSRVRAALGRPSNPPGALAIAMRGYAAADDVDGQRIALDTDRWPAYGWTFAIGDGTANVGWGTIRSHFRGTARTLVERVAAQAAGAKVDELSAHHLPLSTRRPPAADDRVLFVGDAASLINPLSGEGIFYALLSGALAGRIAVATSPDHVGVRYRTALRRRLGRHLIHTRVASRLVDQATLRAAGMRAAARSPAVFADLTDLALGDGVLTPRLLAATARGLLLGTPP